MPDKPLIRVVVCAANKSNITGQILAGARHWDSVMRGMVVKEGKRPPEWVDVEQGFIDQFGKFMTREEAYLVAEAAGQIKYPLPGREGTLYSENLY